MSNRSIAGPGAAALARPLDSRRLAELQRPSPSSHRPARATRTFLKGPIPVWWLEQAAACGGKCIALGLVLWLLSGLQRSRTVRVEYKWCARFAMGRWAVRNGLQRFEQAGLVLVERTNGRCPRVTLCGERNATMSEQSKADPAIGTVSADTRRNA